MFKKNSANPIDRQRAKVEELARRVAADEWELNKNDCRSDFKSLEVYQAFRVAQEIGLTSV